MSHSLQNIPSLWTVVSHWLALNLYMTLLPRRWKGWQTWLGSGGIFLVLLVYHGCVVGLDDAAFNLGMFGFAVLTVVPLGVLTTAGGKACLYYGSRGFILGGFAVSLSWQFYLFYAQRISWLDSAGGQVLFLVALCGGIHLVMFLLERGRGQEIREMPISATAAGTAVFMAFIIYILSSLSFTAIESPLTGDTDAAAFNVRSLVYFGGVALLYAFHLQLCDAHVRQELLTLQGVLNMQYANYCMSQESVALVNQKYHDLKHQIRLLRSEIGTEQKLDCLDQMEQEIKTYEALSRTGNKVLDTILTSKSVYCQNHDIRFTCVVDGSAVGFMSVMDLSALFGNALDNAIESVSQIQDSQQRLIHLSVARQRGFLRIRLENRCSPQLQVSEGLPLSTKKDKRFHGYGLKSIVSTAEKYGGSATVQASGGWFELRVLIPLTDPE